MTWRPETVPPGDAARLQPRFTFDIFRRRTAGLGGPARLELFLALPGELQEGAWEALRRECEARP